MPHINNLVKTTIPGLLEFTGDRREDDRGSFLVTHNSYENPQLDTSLRVSAMQVNIAVSNRGVIRGIHAEPWNKKVFIVNGSAFVAIVDLRRGPTYRRVWTKILNAGEGIFLPKGVGNSYQALENKTVYAYAVNGRWREGAVYPAIRFDDPELAINWPIRNRLQIVSEKDLKNLTMAEYEQTLKRKLVGR